MPVYEYECENCGTRFERIQSMQSEPVRQCPECAGSVHKVLQATGIIFKGSGWYITDSRKSTSGSVAGENKAATPETKTPSESETKSADKSETKTESQPATKTETKTEAK